MPRLAPRAPYENLRQPVLVAEGLRKWWPGSPNQALDDVSITIRPGETLGLVGESGSGKSTLARAVIRLGTVDGGTILLDDVDLTALSGAPLRRVRARIQMIFQDPYSALDPHQKIGAALTEGPISHGLARREAEARALALQPDLLIADEALSALDVTMQAQILELLGEMQSRFGFALLFITHDLRVASSLCDRICVMQSGRIVEEATPRDLFSHPKHNYTRELLAAIPGEGLHHTNAARDLRHDLTPGSTA